MTPKRYRASKKAILHRLLVAGYDIGMKLYLPLLLTVYMPPQQMNTLFLALAPELRHIEEIDVRSPILEIFVKFSRKDGA